MTTTNDYAMAHVVCPRCEAKPGEPCRTVTGTPVPGMDTHASRTRVLELVHDEAYAEGYAAGRARGHSEGFSDGHHEGYEMGWAESKQSGPVTVPLVP